MKGCFMKFALRIAILALFITAVIHAQVSNPSIVPVSTAPSGPCAGGLPNQQVISSGVQYTCQGGTWGIIGTGGGLTLTTAGTSGAATLIAGTLNVPVYGAGLGTVTTTGSPASPNVSCFSGSTSITTCTSGNIQTAIGASVYDAYGAASTAQSNAETYANSVNTSGTAANLSGTPALPNGTTATTQTVGDNTSKLATDAFVIANSGGGGGGGPMQTCDASTVSNYAPAVCVSTLTTANLLALDGTFGTAVNKIAAPGSGKLITPDGMMTQNYIAGSAPFSNSATIYMQVGAGNTFDYTSSYQIGFNGTMNQYFQANSSNWDTLPQSSSVGPNQPLSVYLLSVINLGPITTSSLNANPTVGYVNGDTGTITTGNGDATYIITNAVAGVVQAGGYTITSPGTAYAVGNGQATATGGAQPGIGTGLLIDVNSITQGNGSVVLTIPFTVVPVS